MFESNMLYSKDFCVYTDDVQYIFWRGGHCARKARACLILPYNYVNKQPKAFKIRASMPSGEATFMQEPPAAKKR